MKVAQIVLCCPGLYGSQSASATAGDLTRFEYPFEHGSISFIPKVAAK